MEQSLIVGMAEIKVITLQRVNPARNSGPGDISAVLTALGLGSCVGICLYDRTARVAGMAHVVLPDSSARKDEPPGKFADTALPVLIEEMLQFGASRWRLVAAISGGAQLFTFASDPARLGVGARNAKAVTDGLERHGIPVLARDLGGSQGRTMRLSAVDGRVSVKTIGQSERELVVLGEVRQAETSGMRQVA